MRDIMKSIMKIFAVAAVVALGVITGGCKGSTDDFDEIVVVADRNTIAADGRDVVSVKAMCGAKDVTAEVEWLYNVERDRVFHVGEGRFTTTKAGTFKVSATNGVVSSNVCEVTATEPEKPHVSQFVRHICVMDFTATDCAFCPAGQNQMIAVNGQMEDEATKIHLMALHNPGVDPMGIKLVADMMSDFEISAQPYYLIDMRDKGGISSNEEKSAYRKGLLNSMNNYPARVGVDVVTDWDSATRECRIDVKLLSECNDYWRVAVYVLEDGLSASQNVDGTYKDYIHNHVLRTMVSSSYRGDNVGGVAADTEVGKTYTLTVPEEWVAENCSVCVLAIDMNGFSNNMGKCELIDDHFTYDYLDN